MLNTIYGRYSSSLRAKGARTARVQSSSNLLPSSRVGGTYHWRVHGRPKGPAGSPTLQCRAHHVQQEVDLPATRPGRLLTPQQSHHQQQTALQQQLLATRQPVVLLGAKQQQQQQPTVPWPSQVLASTQVQQADRQRQYRGSSTSCDAQSISRLVNAHQDSSSNSSSNDRSSPRPEPPAAAGAPPPGNSGNSSSGNSINQQPSQKQQQNSGDATASSSETDVDAVVDKMLDQKWQELKRDLKKEMSPEQAAMLDSWNVSDIQTDKVFRDIAEQQLGPILQMMGIMEDPYEFFIDMVKIALALQLGTAALVFYGAELGLGLDAGDGFRAVAGLALGYFLRLGIKIENLAWPIYNGFVQLLIRDDAVYEIPAATPEDRQDTLNKLGLAIASAFLLPKFLLGWQNDDCLQIVAPMVGGLFLFDICYLMALLFKIWGHEDRQD